MRIWKFSCALSRRRILRTKMWQRKKALSDKKLICWKIRRAGRHMSACCKHCMPCIRCAFRLQAASRALRRLIRRFCVCAIAGFILRRIWCWLCADSMHLTAWSSWRSASRRRKRQRLHRAHTEMNRRPSRSRAGSERWRCPVRCLWWAAKIRRRATCIRCPQEWTRTKTA